MHNEITTPNRLFTLYRDDAGKPVVIFEEEGYAIDWDDVVQLLKYAAKAGFIRGWVGKVLSSLL